MCIIQYRAFNSPDLGFAIFAGLCVNLSSHVVVFFLQYMSEKIGGAKGTELDEEFNEMERVCLLCLISATIKCSKIHV